MPQRPGDSESSVRCPRCGRPNAEYSPRCQTCGGPLPEDSGLALPLDADSAEIIRPFRLGTKSLADRDIAHYRLLEPLGRGSMGLVYRAEDRRSGRTVALKTVAVPDQGLLGSIRREIHALSRIHHPGIVRIVDSGAEEGVPWYAMELLEGQTLRESIAQSRGSSMKDALTLARRLCPALAYLHGEGIVHRDLKPENILLRVASSEPAARSEREQQLAAGRPLATHNSLLATSPWPVLVDFGMAAQSAGESSREALEVDGGAGGTPLYMAPEQIRGEPLDARADLYALGCILYELLTGRAPFLGKSAAELLKKHLEEEPVPPSRLAPEVEAHPDGRRLDALVLRLLAKEPRQRFGYAEDVAVELAALGARNGQEAGAPRPRAYLYRPGFCGREAALRWLCERLDGLESGSGGLVLLGGESGVGKTRLLVELGREASRRSLLVLGGECLETGAQRLEGLRKPLQQIADRCRERGRDETERLLGRRGKVLALFEPSLADLPGQEAYPEPEPAELPAEAARLRLYSYLAETFAALCDGSRKQTTGVILLLDDLQWADELVLGFLELGLRAAGGVRGRTPLLIAGAYRSEEAGEGLRRLLGSPGVERLGLGRLEEPAVTEMVGGMLALEPAPQLFSRYLTRHSEGNPFFVAEYLRTAVAEGLLGRDGQGRWQVGRSADRPAAEADYEALPLPRSLRQLVGRRLQGLPAPALRLAEAAAVLGRETEAALLRRMLGLDEAAFSVAVSELLRRQVLEESAPEGLRFVHDKIREVAYARLRKARRQKLHRAAAESIESSRAAELASHQAALGHHWEQAAAPEKARPCYLAAARRATGRYDHAEAERLYRAYLRLVEEPDLESVTAHIELGAHVLHRRGSQEEAICEHRRAVEGARLAGDRKSEAKALHLQGQVHAAIGHPEVAQQLFEQALDLHREVGDRVGEGHVIANMGVLHRGQGRPEQARQLYEQALDLHREVGDRVSEGAVLGNLGILAMGQGRPEQARQLYEHALSILREVGDRLTEAIVLSNLGVLHGMQGQLEEAGMCLEQALAIHRDAGHRLGEAAVLVNLGTLRLEQGRLESALQIFEQTLAICREVGARRIAVTVLASLSSLHLRQGRLEEARRLCEQYLAASREMSDRRSVGEALSSLAGLARLGGDLDTAEHQARKSEEQLDPEGDRLPFGELLCQKGHIELAGGRSGRDLLERAQDLAEATGSGPASDLGQLVSKLRRAVEAFEAGAFHLLFRGELIQDLPEELRR